MGKYDDNFLLNELKRFYNEYNKIPTERDFNNNKNFPSSVTYSNHFGSWNNGLQLAELSINKISKLYGNEYCEICGSNYTNPCWYYKEDLRVCNKCHLSDRKYFHGTSNLNSTTGIGIITEHVVYEVFGDCEKCNIPNNFCAPYDLISKKYGTINVKSAKLSKVDNTNLFMWTFTISKSSKIPDYYICIGFNKTKTEILHVWIISNDSKLITKTGIYITNSERALKRFKQYEVDPEPYNKIYQNLDITTLPEFANVVI